MDGLDLCFVGRGIDVFGAFQRDSDVGPEAAQNLIETVPDGRVFEDDFIGSGIEVFQGCLDPGCNRRFFFGKIET
jgi:hypothetical protein